MSQNQVYSRTLRALLVAAVGAWFVCAAPVQAQVWQDTKAWTPEMEDKYSEWVESELHEEYFTKGKWAGTPTDCADVTYYARLIFAYENSLPYQMMDPSGGGKAISNRMTRFNGQTEDKRVRAFLKYVGDLASTKTLGRDSYPVIVNRTYVRPGGLWARPTAIDRNIWDILTGDAGTSLPGHAEIIKSIEPTGAIWMLESTVPKAVRNLNLTSNLWFLPENQDNGLRKWLKPEQYNMPFAQLPGYSLEQFKELGKEESRQFGESATPTTSGRRTLDQFKKDVYARLAVNGREESTEDLIRRNIKSLCGSLNVRNEAVQRALAFKAKIGGRCMNASEYDNNSTPSRDKRAKDLLRETAKLVSMWGLTDASVGYLEPYMTACPAIVIAPGRSLTMKDWAYLAKDDKVSSNPNDSLEARWGLASGQSSCPTY